MDYYRKNRERREKKSYYDDDYYDSIYDYDSNTENKVTKSYSNYSERYKNGYSASSYWLNLSSYNADEKNNDDKLKESLAFICRSVNIIRHRYGMGAEKSLSVQWADNTMQFNTANNEIVYLNPSPLLDGSNGYNDNQRYDVIVGQALLSSVQKHLITYETSLFSNNLLTVAQDVSIVAYDDKLKVSLLDGDKQTDLNFIEKREPNGDVNIIQDYLKYEGHKGEFSSINMPAIFVNGAVQVWRAVEQVIAETAISNEYKGSVAYLYSHRNYYNDPKYLQSLQQALKIYDENNSELCAFVLAIHNVLNDNMKITKDDCHSFYHPIIDMVDSVLRKIPDCSSETRLASALHFSSDLFEYIEKRKKEGDLPNNPSEKSGEGQPKKDEKNGKVSDSNLKRISDLTKNGLAPSLNNMVCKKDTHCKATKNVGKLAVGDEKGIRNLEAELLASGFTDVNITEESFYKNKEYVQDRYNAIASKHRQYIDMLRERLFVRTLENSAAEYNMKSGNMDEHSLWKLCDLSDDDSNSIFFQHNIPQKVEKCHINILFDNSGSMGENNRINVCREISVIMNEAVKGIPNVKLSFYSFTDHKFYKFECASDAVAMREQGGTDEGGAMGCVIREINNHRTDKLINGDNEYEKTFFLAVGDGGTDGEKVRKSLQYIERENIKFFHVGIDNAYNEAHGKKLYGEDKFAIIPTENLMASLCNFLLKVLT